MDLARDFVSENPDAVGRVVCEAYTAYVDAFVADVFDRAAHDRRDVALLAIGGYGRHDLSLGSDIDLLLLHDAVADVGPFAEAILYPLWDAGAKVGHAVRTGPEALSLAAEDLDSATALLSARHLCGDRAMALTLIGDAAEQWRQNGDENLAAMARRVRERHRDAGEAAFLLEPDLKEGRGGLRDVQSVRWAAQAGADVWPGDEATLAEAYGVLVDARVELHRHSGRPTNVLTLQDQDPVAAALGYVDADDLMRAVSSAARTIAFCSDRFWRRSAIDTGGSGGCARPDRVLGPGVALRAGTVRFHARTSAISPSTPVEVAASAAQVDAPIHRKTLESLARAEAMTDSWPLSARQALVALLASGRPAITQIEDLDQYGLMSKLLPEWEAVRSRPQRNAYHTFTVDRHLCETAANAAALAGRVQRRDLLVIGALLHDIGKGVPGDHTDNGMAMVADIGRRMGFGDGDVDSLVAMVEHHLLLPDVATRRDLDDPDVIERVAATVGTLDRLRLLHALVVADSRATGPAAWSPWKSDLVDTLVRRVAHVLGGGTAEDTTDDFPDVALVARAASRRRVVEIDGAGDVIVIDDDRPGLFARVAGSLALHGLDVLDANIATVDGRAIERIGVHPGGHGIVDWDAVVADIHLALDGKLAIRARLALRADAYRRVIPRPTSPVQVHFHSDESSSATIVDVFAPDAIGALYRITSAIAELDLDLIRARIQTMGDGVVDSFYVVDSNGSKLADTVIDEVRLAVVHALEG